MPIKILLVDDHAMVRQGLRALLEHESDFEVVGEAGDGRTAVELVDRLKPDVVVMDVMLPELNGADAARQIREAAPRCKVIGLSMYAARRFVAAMLRAGATGYILKEAAFDELVRAIRDVYADRFYLSPAITGVVIEDYIQQMEHTKLTPAPSLTPRQREVLQLIAEGIPTKQIAARLGVSVKTIETLRKQIMDKLGLRSIAQLTKYAVREGLSSPNP